MKVLFDLAELGGHNYAGVGGVRRVIENVASRLLAYPGLDVQFTGLSPIEARSIAEQMGASGPKFHSSSSYMLGRMAQAGSTFIHQNIRNAGVATKIVRRSFRLFSRGEQLLAERVSSRILRRSQIFHSPFRPLPQSVQRYKTLSKFLTIYDLIPIRNPELASSHFAIILKKILRSIQPDTWIFCISQWVKDDFCELTGHPPDRVIVTSLAASKVIFNPVSEDTGSAVRRRYGIPGAPYILSVGAMDARKNISFLVACFAKLIRSGEGGDLNLVLVGNKDASEMLRESLSADPLVKSRIVCTGKVPDSDISSIYSGAAAFAFPSLAEGFGLPVLEAMQCGIPVICSNTTSLPEIVGSAGLLLDPRDGDGWINAMMKIPSDLNLQVQLRKAALARAQLFSWENTAETIVNSYTKAISHS